MLIKKKVVVHHNRTLMFIYAVTISCVCEQTFLPKILVYSLLLLSYITHSSTRALQHSAVAEELRFTT